MYGHIRYNYSTSSYLRRGRGRDVAIMQLGGAGGRAQSVGVGAMRGSTAGLADTVAGGGRARAALLHLADAVFASVVVAPAVVAYWKATWTLLDLYTLPDSPVASAAVCAVFGLTCNLVLCVAQTQLTRLLAPAAAPHPWWWYVVSRAYTGAAGVACVAAWRGVWNLLNECTGDSARTLLSTTAAATLSLAALRSLRNICAAPFAIAIDSPQDYFDVPTMFRTVSVMSLILR